MKEKQTIGDGPAGGGSAPVLALPVHGGDPSAISAVTGVPIAVDLSTGINPWPYPIVDPDLSHYTRLPGSLALERLCATAATAFGVTDHRAIAATPGSQAAIQWLPRLRPKRGRVHILSPTYSEHAAAWNSAGHEVTTIERLPDTSEMDSPDAPDVIVLTNPNNPDGNTVWPRTLLSLTEALAARGGWLVVDEAFADVTPTISVAPAAPREGLITLRSFGKFFGLPGIRIGFAIGPHDFVNKLKVALGPWPVSGHGIATATQALGDREWQLATRTRLGRAAAALDLSLEACGLTPLGGTDLFRFAGCQDGHSLFWHLAKAGVLIRCFDWTRDRVRIGLPPDSTAEVRLVQALHTAQALP